MRVPLVAGNWKMNTTIPEAVKLVSDMISTLDTIHSIDKAICPPFISLVSVSEIIKGTSIKLGAQNVFFQEKGAYTGEISPLMLAGLCELVIVGHSERRQYFYETSEIVNKKVNAALKAGLKPILCVGEKLDDNENGKTEEVVGEQFRSSLAGIEDIDEISIAYEPIWAIGTGRAATGEQANNTIGFIRRLAGEIYGRERAGKLRILYGGSVTQENTAEFMNQPEIDGALVGGASLKADQFLSIARQTSEIRK